MALEASNSRGRKVTEYSLRHILFITSLSVRHTHRQCVDILNRWTITSRLVAWQGNWCPHSKINCRLSENLLLVGKFSSKNTKFGAKNLPFCSTSRAKLKFWAPVSHLTFRCSGRQKMQILKKFIVSDNMLCQVFKDVAMDELALLASNAH